MPGVEHPVPASPATPAWSAADLATDPHRRADKQERVQRMFASIARSYDLNNRLHSFGLDQRWRRFVVREAGVKSTDHVLDVACGTGDLTRAFAAAGAARVVGLDFTPEMLEVARRKRLLFGSPASPLTVEYLQGDAQALPFPDASFDIISIAFGIRNVQVPAQAIAEFFRVLRPGGRLMILELGRPRNPFIRWFNDLYTWRIVPVTATIISRDRSGAYRYLPKSVEKFLTAEELDGMVRQAGLQDATSTPLTFGVCACHRAVKP